MDLKATESKLLSNHFIAGTMLLVRPLPYFHFSNFMCNRIFNNLTLCVLCASFPVGRNGSGKSNFFYGKFMVNF